MRKLKLPELEPTIKYQVFGVEFDTTENLAKEYERWVERVSLPLEQLGAIGGEFTLCVTPTSIGISYVVKHAKGEHFDLTPYSNW